MAKLTILATLLLVLLALIEATTFRTTVTTTTIEEENQRVTERCREQVQGQEMRHCMMYMSQQQSPYDDQLSLRMVTNPQEQQHLRQCCMEMRNIDGDCRCEAIRVMMRKMQMQGEWQGEQMHEAMQKAKYLPRMCNMRPQQCQW